MNIMDHETKYQTNHQFRRLPKGERRVRFADSMGMELASVFLIDLISNYYFASIHKQSIAASNNNSKEQTTSTTTSTTTTATPNHHLHHPQHHLLKKSSTFNTTNTTTTTTTNATITTTSPATATNSTIVASRTPAFPITAKTPAPAILTTAARPPTTIHQHPTYTSYQQQSQLQNQNQEQQQQQQLMNQQQQQLSTSYACQFTQPISLISFKERVKINKVHLETCSINTRAGNISVSCTIRVLNQSFDKSVIVRYTTDEWHTHTDTLASYVPGSCDGWSDKFTSTFSVTNQVRQFQTGQRIIFAVKIVFDGDKVFWDNNGGLNYTIKKI